MHYEESGVEFSFQDPLPLQDFFHVIDEHFSLRKSLVELNDILNDHAHQFRVIEKRLLVRYEEK